MDITKEAHQKLALALQTISTTLAIDAIGKADPQSHVVRHCTPTIASGARIAGPVRTVRFLPDRGDVEPQSTSSLLELIDTVVAGEVLVLAAAGSSAGAIIGDLLASRISARGGIGVVTDGYIRDMSGLEDVGLPIFSKGCIPNAIRDGVSSWESDIPVSCGGALIRPGDWALADIDGVLVFSRETAESIANRKNELLEKECILRESIKAGTPLLEAFPAMK